MSTTKRTAAQSKALAALAAPGSMGRRTAGATAAALDASPAALGALVRQGLARVCGTWRDDLSGAPTRYRITTEGMGAAESDAEATTGGITVTDTEGRIATARRLDDLPNRSMDTVATYIVRDGAGVTLGSATCVLDDSGQRVWHTSAGETAMALWQAVRSLANMGMVAHVRPADPEPAVKLATVSVKWDTLRAGDVLATGATVVTAEPGRERSSGETGWKVTLDNGHVLDEFGETYTNLTCCDEDR